MVCPSRSHSPPKLFFSKFPSWSLQSPSSFIPLPCVFVLTKRPGHDQELLQPETLKGKIFENRAGTSHLFWGCPTGESGREWGDEKAERSLCHKDSLALAPFPSYPWDSSTPFFPVIVGKGNGVAVGALCPAPQPGNFCSGVKHSAHRANSCRDFAVSLRALGRNTTQIWEPWHD